MTERQWQRRVVDFAKYRGWLVWHDSDSRRNTPGLPDLLLVRAGKLITAELKSDAGRLRAEQSTWLAAFGEVPGCTAVVWRPADWTAVVEALS